jgi:integrase
MSRTIASEAKVIRLPQRKQDTQNRKAALNKNKEGSVRKIGGKVYVDFYYFGDRVRECSGLVWNDENARSVRQQLDRIVVSIDSGTFRFSKVFEKSKRKEFFDKKEAELYGSQITPDEIKFGEYAWKWYELKRNSWRVTGRTLKEYKSYLDLYLIPFLGEKTFAQLNAHLFEQFVSYARGRKIKKESVCHKSINKYFIPLRMVCTQAAIEFNWTTGFNPFFGFKRLPEQTNLDEIMPFTVAEQEKLLGKIPDHWRPYFQFAFRAGLRPGEQIGLKPEDIDWTRKVLTVQRAVTLDEEGNRVLGNTKNKYSKRAIKLNGSMLEALNGQKEIHDKLKCEFFFCTPTGSPVYLSNLRRTVWIPALEKAELRIRELKQTRHSFATTALSCRENPLWIAHVMGHRDSEMVLKVYTRYAEGITGIADGSSLDKAFCQTVSKQKENEVN